MTTIHPSPLVEGPYATYDLLTLILQSLQSKRAKRLRYSVGESFIHSRPKPFSILKDFTDLLFVC